MVCVVYGRTCEADMFYSARISCSLIIIGVVQFLLMKKFLRDVFIIEQYAGL